jgi:hypothetical protein
LKYKKKSIKGALKILILKIRDEGRPITDGILGYTQAIKKMDGGNVELAKSADKVW